MEPRSKKALYVPMAAPLWEGATASAARTGLTIHMAPVVMPMEKMTEARAGKETAKFSAMTSTAVAARPNSRIGRRPILSEMAPR